MRCRFDSKYKLKNLTSTFVHKSLQIISLLLRKPLVYFDFGCKKAQNMSSPALSPELSEKNKKYDRQIRLWGEHGQSLLEAAQLCLVNVTALGTEILKNIVLPGIGGFTIVDGGLVTEEDIGCNFFLDANSVGLSRAKCCMQLLQEMNPDVSSDYLDESIETLLENNPEFFSAFKIVIASSLKEKTLIALSRLLWEQNIPFVYCHSVGFIASARLQFTEHYVIETHPDNKQSDLRLEQPFEALQKYLDNIELSHKVPWIAIAYKFLKKWQEKNGNRVPSNFKEKSELKKMIQEAITKDEENYEEAVKSINSCFGGGKPTTHIWEILNDPACTNLNKKSSIFWILVRAVRDFIESDSNGWLPVPGIIPDMTADTENYINLQTIYRTHAIQDADMVYKRAQQHLQELNLPSELITDKEVKLFCREFASIAVVRGTCIADEYEKPPANLIASELEDTNSLMVIYVALRALDKFQSEHGTHPGDIYVESDTARIKAIACKYLSEWSISAPFSDDWAHELCRYGGAEVHTVSAFMGGCVAQEIIKLITKQYKPINNTFIYNAITSETAVFKL